MTVAIAIEGLGKKFALRHQAGRKPYSTFRDALTDGVKYLGKKLVGRGGGKDSMEEFWALDDISLDIREGEKVGVIGRNGAGKSTLLKILSRIIEPSRGRIRIRGRVASLLEVGTGFHPELTGRENIFFNGSILGMTKAEIVHKFDEIVAFAEVEKFLDTPVKHYSSGMYVRLGFAVAAHLEPEILVVDEVLAVGDARFQKKCLGKLEEVGRQGRTVMFVSHNMSSILQFTDRTILLGGGRVLFDGDSEAGVMQYIRVNEEAGKATDLDTHLPWFKIDSLTFDQSDMAIGFNRPLRFRLDVSVGREVKEFMMTFGIFNSIGARIITARGMIPFLPSGTHGIALDIPDHRLIPGDYSISVVLRSAEDLIFSKEQVIAFELLADDIDDPLLLPIVARAKDRWGSYCAMSARLNGFQAD
ncbi:polysaccharide ABC transporter ATP-binding protein [Methylomagnum ishizawai]|uniref:ABC transporter ATP-binding protein n=1 Tax=Methylomagnum ishizawai TaxID=1760988 RepID=UPI001C31EBFF|nr:polysaccharide ABC transporter ATP-binding protein [Methylomagnum ishizawai]BBL76650.1 ABC transporter ATP-binding protein [Methylomagnum ishizawai]